MDSDKRSRPKIGFRDKNAAEDAIKVITSLGSPNSQRVKIKSLQKRAKFTLTKTKTPEKSNQLNEAIEVFENWLEQNPEPVLPPSIEPSGSHHCTLMEESLHYANRVRGLGFKDKSTAELSLQNIEGRDPDYQKLVVIGLLNNAKSMLRKVKTPEKVNAINDAIEVFKDFLIKFKAENRARLMCRYLPADVVARFPIPSDQLQKEFIDTYKVSKDYKRFRYCYPYGSYLKTWDIVRNENLWRIKKEIDKENTPLWNNDGSPTEMHLKMIYWAYSPEPMKVKEYSDRRLTFQ